MGREAAANARKIDRHRSGLVVEQQIGTGKGESGRLVILPTSEEDGLPVVHGWRSETGSGEYSALVMGESGFEASRDPAGTRPLFLSESGRWVASDWRFVRSEGSRLLPAGATSELPSGRVRERTIDRQTYTWSFEEAATKLARTIEMAVAERLNGVTKAAVAFSGGLDSSILAVCAKRHGKTIACAVSAPGSKDSTGAVAAAEVLGIELVEERISAERVRGELEHLHLPFAPTRMDRSLWCIYSVASKAAAEAGAGAMFLGQLADELFGGYAKYQRALQERGPESAEAMMHEDVSGCGTRGFIRDESACSRWIEPRFPFSDERVLGLGFAMPVKYKLRGQERKAVLREAAIRLGVPVELAFAPKKAAQYSSGIQKLVA